MIPVASMAPHHQTPAVGVEAVRVKGWWRAHQWLVLRRLSQALILALFLLGPLAGVWIIKGTLSSSVTLGVLPLTDPLTFLQMLVAHRGTELSALMDGTRRAMKAALQREVDALESHLSFLATVGSVSPYIGLFGTVWGIMNAFRGLSNVAQATLAQVAPGIAEALVATAIGLFAAIPAVIAYNRSSHDIDRLVGRYESFMEELSNILQRQAHQPTR